MFTGFTEETTRFFLDIRFHNSAEYFQANRDRYVRDVQTPFYALIGDLVPVLQTIDPLMEIRPHRVLSRLRRDTRFSRDKSPYRDHLWLWFKRGGEERWMSTGFWFEFGPDRLSWGLGTWGENRPLMDRFRREIAANPARVGGILTACDLPGHHLALGGERFKRMEVPEGVPEHLRPWYLAREVAVSQTRPDFRETGSHELAVHVAEDYRALGPVYRLLRGMQDELDSAAEAEEAKKAEEAARRKAPPRADEW